VEVKVIFFLQEYDSSWVFEKDQLIQEKEVLTSENQSQIKQVLLIVLILIFFEGRHGRAVKVVDFKPLAPYCYVFESC
jgi:hypothetical protein